MTVFLRHKNIAYNVLATLLHIIITNQLSQEANTNKIPAGIRITSSNIMLTHRVWYFKYSNELESHDAHY